MPALLKRGRSIALLEEVGAPEPARGSKRGLTAVAFVNEVATLAGASPKVAKACLRAAQSVVSRELGAGASVVGVPGLAKITLRLRPAREESEKIFFGKVITVQARGASRQLRATPAKGLKDICCAPP